MKDLKARIAAFQKDSWQLEAFISGGIVYWLFSLTDSFQDFFFEVYPITYTSSNQIVLLFGAYTITRALLIGFAANLLLRAIWLAYLGITYWYPKDINTENLPPHLANNKRLTQSKSAVDRLMIIERWCNLSFSFAVIFALFGSSLLLVLSGIIWIILQIIGENFFHSPWVTYSLVFGLILIQLGILDRLLYWKGSNNSRFSRIRDKILTFLDIVSLSFLFKREFLVLRTNAKRWFIYGITALYLGLAMLMSINHIGAYYPFGTFNITVLDDRTQYNLPRVPNMNALRYETALSETRPAFFACIQSEMVSDDYLKLFVVYWVSFEQYLNDRFDHYGYQLEQPKFDTQAQYDAFRVKSDSIFQRALNDLFTVRIDQQKQENLIWRTYSHPASKEEGYVTYIPIDELTKAEHLLKLETTYLSNGKPKVGLWTQINFWTQD